MQGELGQQRRLRRGSVRRGGHEPWLICARHTAVETGRVNLGWLMKNRV